MLALLLLTVFGGVLVSLSLSFVLLADASSQALVLDIEACPQGHY